MAELKQRVAEALGQCSKNEGYDWRIVAHREPILNHIMVAVRDLTEQNDKAIKALKKIAATKNIKMSEFPNKMENWEIAETALKALGVEWY